MTNEIWVRVKDQLKASLGSDAYQNWIEPIGYMATDRGQLVLSAPTRFIGNWVTRNYGGRIRELFETAGASVDRVQFEVIVAKPIPAMAEEGPAMTSKTTEITQEKPGTLTDAPRRIHREEQ